MADLPLSLVGVSSGDSFPDPNKWTRVYSFNGSWVNANYTVAEAHKYVLVVGAAEITQYQSGSLNFKASSGTVILDAGCGGKNVSGFTNAAGRAFMVKDTKANTVIWVTIKGSVISHGEYAVFVQD